MIDPASVETYWLPAGVVITVLGPSQRLIDAEPDRRSDDDRTADLLDELVRHMLGDPAAADGDESRDVRSVVASEPATRGICWRYHVDMYVRAPADNLEAAEERASTALQAALRSVQDSGLKAVGAIHDGGSPSGDRHRLEHRQVASPRLKPSGRRDAAAHSDAPARQVTPVR